MNEGIHENRDTIDRLQAKGLKPLAIRDYLHRNGLASIRDFQAFVSEISGEDAPSPAPPTAAPKRRRRQKKQRN